MWDACFESVTLSVHYGFCPLEKLTFKDLAKLTAFAAIFKTKSYFRWDIWGSLFIQFHFFHIFDSPFTFSWVLIISDKLQWPRKGSWGTSWILPSKSGSKYFLKNIMTENIWKIFAPWRGPQVKLLFSTFFQVTVYLVDTQNFRVTWRPLHVFCKYFCKYRSYLIKKIFGIIFWELSIM